MQLIPTADVRLPPTQPGRSAPSVRIVHGRLDTFGGASDCNHSHRIVLYRLRIFSTRLVNQRSHSRKNGRAVVISGPPVVVPVLRRLSPAPPIPQGWAAALPREQPQPAPPTMAVQTAQIRSRVRARVSRVCGESSLSPPPSARPTLSLSCRLRECRYHPRQVGQKAAPRPARGTCTGRARR